MIVKNREQLSIPCTEVSLEEGLRQAALLLSEIGNHAARGLAANQIGLTGRVFILQENEVCTVYINPEIVDEGLMKIEYKEGCLSFPEDTVTTSRYSKIYVKDLLNPIVRILTGIEAIAFQHELDHLDGITFHSRAKPQ